MSQVKSSKIKSKVDEDPLICYGEVVVFMCSEGVICDTAPAPLEECSHPPLSPPLLQAVCLAFLTLSDLLMVLMLVPWAGSLPLSIHGHSIGP